MRSTALPATLILALLAPVILSACGTSGAQFQEASPGADRALVYIFRKSAAGGSASAFRIHANGEYITNMSNGGYFPYQATPGDLHIKAEIKPNVLNWGPLMYMTDKPELDLQVEGGKTYFVEFEFGGLGGPKLTLLDDQVAPERMRECHQTETLR
jgi:hypothetical protein